MHAVVQNRTIMVETNISASVRQQLRWKVTGPRAVVALAVWSVAYAGYRAYYALGGQIGQIGQPVSAGEYRAINAVGAGIIALAGVLPLVAIRVGPLRRALPAIGWLGAVGCCMHALVDISLRLLSVTGVRPTQLPSTVWRSFDRQLADLQDLLLNEPWFFVEGLLWGALGFGFVQASRQRAWVVTALGACAVLTAVGLLTGLGAIGSFHLG
ncbi:MAG: hypothetical protein WAK18_04925 [Nocardioidaceae bacterium]